MRYSVVIPAHNEAAHLEASVTRFLEALPASVSAVLAEVILVENGSTDGTLAACERLRVRYPDLVRVYSNARGSYGEAVKRGLLESRGTHVSVLECDLLDVGFVARSIALFAREEVRFIVASKRHPGSVDRRPLKRRLLTWGFNVILRATTGYPGTDTHGLKSFDGELGRSLCRLAVTSDEAFQTELVLLAWRLGHRIAEVPIEVRETRPTPVAIVRRMPSVLTLVRGLHASLARLPARGAPALRPEMVPARWWGALA